MTNLSTNDLINISKLIPDIDELGLNLDFNCEEVEAFQKENEMQKDIPSMVMEGTFQMLKSWSERDGSFENFLEALRVSDMGNLADEILAQKGNLNDNTQSQGPSGAPNTQRDQPSLPSQPQPLQSSQPQSLQSSQPQPLQLSQPQPLQLSQPQPLQSTQPAQVGNDGSIDDETLRKLGKRLFTGVDELASALGVKYADLKRYKATNYRTGDVTADGTIQMLFDWREKIPPPEQRTKLGQALQKAQLLRIKEEYHF